MDVEEVTLIMRVTWQQYGHGYTMLLIGSGIIQVLNRLDRDQVFEIKSELRHSYTMKELEKLHSKLVKAGKDEPVQTALHTLLHAPENLDYQIDVVGAAHQCNWLPNRKKALWNVFPVNSVEWIDRCIARSVATGDDLNALCALLNSSALTVSKIIQTHSSDLVNVWDVNGAEFCGIGLAHHQGSHFDRYYYIGWKPGHDTIWRLEFISHVEAPSGQNTQRLNQLKGRCKITKGCWAELPYGFGYRTNYHEFTDSYAGIKPYGYTKDIMLHLGYT